MSAGLRVLVKKEIGGRLFLANSKKNLGEFTACRQFRMPGTRYISSMGNSQDLGPPFNEQFRKLAVYPNDPAKSIA